MVALDRLKLGNTHSDQWYRVADLHPRLQAHAVLRRHRYREEVWYLLEDQISGRQHRLNPLAWALVGRLDGRQSLQQIWDTLVAEHGAQAPTQPEVLSLLSQLHGAELLLTESAPDLTGLFERRRKSSSQQRRARRNPLAWRVPLFNPSRLLDTLLPLGRLLFSPTGAALCVLVLALALLAAAGQAGALHTYAGMHLQTPRMLLWLWLCYPAVKALHELGHGLAVRTWGGAVREMGVTLMLLTPVPYVDASAATAFRERGRRVWVSLMGITAELMLAAAALVVWLLVADGVVREVAFAVMFIGSVSTLLFNGNPLLRMDAYHALADFIESPGLAPRGRAYMLYLARHHLLGVRRARAPAVARGEKRWLLGYFVVSGAYRVLISLLIIGWLLDWHLVLGVLALAWLAYSALLQPMRLLLRYVRRSAELSGRRVRAALVCGTAVLLVPLLLFALPLPALTRAQGVVWLPEQAFVRAAGAGFVEQVLVQDGQTVAQGQALLQLADPSLPAEIERLHARLRGLDAAVHLAVFSQSPKSGALAQELERTQAEHAHALAREETLTVRATSSGTLVLARAQDLPGSFVPRGGLVGHVLPNAGAHVRVVVAQDDVTRLQQRPGPVEVRFADRPAHSWPAHQMGQVPAASRELPSALLGERAGGPFATDPADAQARRTLEPVFSVDLAVPSRSALLPGTRVWARFDHGSEALAWQWLRQLRQLFIGRLGGQTRAGA